MKRAPPLLLLLALLASGPAAAVGRNASPDIVEDALALALVDRTKAARLLEDALEHSEGYKAKEEPLVMVYAGEQRRLLGDFEEARDWFTRVLVTADRGWEVESARLGLALVDAVEGVTPGVIGVLESIRERDALATQNADRYLILTMRAARQNDAPAAREYSALSLDYAQEDPNVAERIRAHLAALVDEDTNALVYHPTQVAPPEDVLAAMSDLERAEKALEAGNAERVLKLAAKVAGDPEATEADKRAAAYLERRLEAAPVEPGRIGVLLPLSDRYEAAGLQVQRALRFGFERAGGRAKLVFEDSGSTPETAVAALEKLVLEEGVVAVVGPLLTDEAPPVAEAAEALRVPLIGLSQSLMPSEEQNWVYQAMMSPQDQVRALVDYVMGTRHLRSFAVFAPDNNYGRAATETFADEVAERGGEVTIVEFYDPAATDLIPFAQTLGRKDYKARRWEFEKLKEEAEAKGGNPDKVVLPPTIDFEALFLPDNASRIPIAAAALAYEEFPLGEFQTSKDGDTLPMLGLSGWNNPLLVTQGGPYVRGAIFTDAYFPDDERAATFSAAYASAIGKAPSSLEAVTVDAGHLLAAVTTARPETRADFRDALREVEVEGTLTGASTIDPESHSLRRTIRMLTIGEDAIEPLVMPTPADPAQTAAP